MVKKLLCIDGGGSRGVISLTFLKHMENALNIRSCDYFDLYAGTSTGALICALMVNNNLSASEILNNIYDVDDLKTIMKQSYLDWIFGTVQFTAKYSDKQKLCFINKKLGNPDKTIYDLNKKILITAYNPSTKQPVFFRNYLDSKNYRLNEICNATSAAPVYFPAVKVNELDDSGEYMWLIDGGICCNNPAYVGYLDAIELYPNEKIEIYSLGTGIYKPSFDQNKDINNGGIEWLLKNNNIIDTLMDGNQITSHMCCKKLAKDRGDKYIRINKYIEHSSGIIDDSSEKNYNKMIKDGDLWWNEFEHQIIDLHYNK